MKLKYILPAISLFCLAGTLQTSAQFHAINTGKLQVYASVKEDGKPLKQTDIIIMEDVENNGSWEEVQQLATTRNGEFSVRLDYGSKYKVIISKKDYATKTVEFDTDVHDQTINSLDFYFIMDMVSDKEGIPFLKPVASVYYNIKKNEFDYALDDIKADLGK